MLIAFVMIIEELLWLCYLVVCDVIILDMIIDKEQMWLSSKTVKECDYPVNTISLRRKSIG